MTAWVAWRTDVDEADLVAICVGEFSATTPPAWFVERAKQSALSEYEGGVPLWWVQIKPLVYQLWAGTEDEERKDWISTLEFYVKEIERES